MIRQKLKLFLLLTGLFATFCVSTFFLNSGTPKVYDCFCFNNEFEILKIRLEELWDSVDYFVLVESIETQRGNVKPLYFQENKHLFEKYSEKIIHIAIDEQHPEFGLWERENYQRNCISRGLSNCKKNDIIIISDLDEIPRKEQFPQFIQAFQKAKPFKKKQPRAVSLQQDIYFFQLNRQTPTGETWGGGIWVGTVITSYKELLKKNPQFFRDKRFKFPIIQKGGWHFTWTGGIANVRKKMMSVVEGTDDASVYSDEYLHNWVESHPSVPLDNRFPTYVLQNAEYFKSIGYIAEEPSQQAL